MLLYLRRRTRPYRHGLTLGAIVIFVWFIRGLPQAWANQVGRTFGILIGRLAMSARRVTRKNLSQALLVRPPSVDGCWADLGQRVVEFACMKRMLSRVVIDLQSECILREAMEGPTGTLVATAHYGNWELMAAALAEWGFPVYAIAAESKSSIHRWLDAERQRFGVRTCSRGGGAQLALAQLKAGQPVALFVDQVSGSRRRTGFFLGRPAYGPLTYDRLQKLSRAAGLFIWNRRDADGNYRIHVQKVPDGQCAGPWFDEVLGQIIQDDPQQWVWLHDRWT